MRALASVSGTTTFLRLNKRHREDIRDIAHGVEESCVGVCTRYLLDRSLSHAPEPAVAMHEVEKFVDRYSVFAHPEVATWRQRVQRARRAFARMTADGFGAYVAYLHIAYGPEDPVTRTVGAKLGLWEQVEWEPWDGHHGGRR